MRKHKRTPGSARYKDYTDETMALALREIKEEKKSVLSVSLKYNIGKSTLYDKLKNIHPLPIGRPTGLRPAEEKAIADYVVLLSDYGFPLDKLDIRLLVQSYLNANELKVNVFVNNFPGPDWANDFVRRNNLTARYARNISKQRAAVSEEIINDYFNNLAKQIVISPSDADEDNNTQVPPENILNCDETNLSDDPKAKRVITRRGVKYPEIILNHSKSSVSVMFAGTATGELLPPYVCYKSKKKMYTQWCENGPKNCRYARTESGWFDRITFEDWFFTIALPYFQKKQGKKIIICDNLAAHVSIKVLEACKSENIAFVCLPPRSTHLTQPLDVGYFRSLKGAWRKILRRYRESRGHNKTGIDKSHFPGLLKKLLIALGDTSQKALKGGFKKAGIYPFDRQQVLNTLPSFRTADVSERVSPQVIKLLNEMRFGTDENRPRRRKQINVPAGGDIVSILNIENDDENLPEQPPAKRARRALTELHDNNDELQVVDSEEEDEATDGFQSPDTYLIGDFVIVVYEGEYFPGQVKKVAGEDLYEVSTMTMSGSNWKWPDKVDLCQYPSCDIVQKIKPPIIANGRLVCKVPEMANLKRV